MIIDAAREQQYNQNKFIAAMKGIDLDAASKSSKPNRVEEIKARVAARQQGKSEEQMEIEGMFGFESE